MPTVLIVDHEPSIRNLIRLTLAKDGYTVLDANGPSEAQILCKSLGTQVIDLLIIDHGMAPLKGRDVAEKIMKSCPAMKVLVISALNYRNVQDDDGFLPGSSFLQKPFTAQQILSMVQTMLFPNTH